MIETKTGAKQMHTDRRFLTVMLLASLTVLAAVHPMLPVHALRDRKALLPTEDSEVRSAEPDINWGRDWEFWVEGADEEVLSFLMFDLSQIPSGATIEEATLRLHATDGTSNGTVNLHYCPDNDWTEDSITYNNRPAFQLESMGTVNVTYGVATWYEWNITSLAISTFSAADKRLSLALNGYTTNGSFATFDSRQSPMVDKRPQLSVLYSYTPSPSIDPVLVGLVVVGIAVASAVGLQLAYTRRKRRKQP